MSKRESFLSIIICLLYSFISIMCLNHNDLTYIGKWGITLLEHIHANNLSDFAVDLVAIGYGTNYNLFQNLNVALWLSPIYIFAQIFNISMPIVIYHTWMKFVVFILHVVCAWLFHNLIQKLDVDDYKTFVIPLLYMTSPIVVIYGVGIGQIDCIGILFFLLSLNAYLDKKYNMMSLFIGLAFLSKSFVVIFYVPMFILCFKDIKKMVKYISIAASIPLLDKILTYILIPNYNAYSSEFNGTNFIPRLFETSILYESLFVMIVLILCGVCLILRNRNVEKKVNVLLFPSLIFFFLFLLVYWHPQWMMYLLPILLLMGCYIKNEYEFVLYYFGFSLGFVIHTLVNFNTNIYGAILIENSLLGKIFYRDYTYIGTWILENVSGYIGGLGYTVMLSAFALLIIVYVINNYKVIKSDIDNNVVVPKFIWHVIAVVPVGLYYMILFLGYFGLLN